MINVKDQVYTVIKDLTDNVGDSYPRDWGTLPAIQYCEEENKVYEYTDSEEQSAYVRFRFDIWNNTTTSDMAVQLDNCVSQLGLKRTQCTDVEDPSGLKHKQMRYEGIIDVSTFFVNHA
jgi:hypothetical protein|nr:MAG TPA: tail component [Caudoviricetes sp.]